MIKTFINQRFLSVFFLGFASGLPLALSGSTLQAWYTVEGINIVHITSLALIGLPYLYKFLWAPVFDRYRSPFGGRRRGWIAIMQLALIATLLLMTCFSPTREPYFLALIGLALAFFSASQDITIDAYRAELLLPPERGLGAAYTVAGYRLGMIVSGALAMIMADTMGWRFTYEMMAVCLAFTILATAWAPQLPEVNYRPQSLKESISQAYQQYMQRQSAYLLLAFIVLYKLGDAFTSSSGSLVTLFLLRELNLTLTAVGIINKGLGLTCSLFGIFLGGILLTRISMYQALLYFGLLQAVSNLLFLLLAVFGNHNGLLPFVIAIENVASGLGAAAFTAFLMSLCTPNFAATQFALFTALAALGRVVLAPAAGLLVEHSGWILFFFTTFLLALPSLVVLKYLQAKECLQIQNLNWSSLEES